MPPHVTIPALDPITIDGGETSATQTKEIWNDKLDAFLDTTTAEGIVLQLLAAWVIGYTTDEPPEPIWGPFRTSGHPVLEERWTRAKVAKYLSTPDGGDTVVETNQDTTGTQPWGANSDLILRDLAPQEGARVEFYVTAPGGRGLFNVRLAVSVLGNQSSQPLSRMTSIASGSGVVPADRQPNFRSLLDGGGVTANDTDTVTIARGHMSVDGTVITFLQTTQQFNLNDSEAVALLAGEDYRVTLSKDATGANVVTKGPKAENVLYPTMPAGNVFLANLIVASADGVAVTVAPASVLTADRKYAAMHALAGTGLTALIARGDAIAATDIAPRLTHEIPVALTASETNRIWQLADGNLQKTLTDAEPYIGAQLLWHVITDATSVTSIVDKRAMVHRAQTIERLELVYRAVMTAATEPDQAVAWCVGPGYDFELELVTVERSGNDAGWTGSADKFDVRYFAAGAAVPFPAGGAGAGGATIFTGFATDDQRPSIAYNAAALRVATAFHQVRRFPAYTRLVLDHLEHVDGPGGEPEQEVRVTLHVRRYR